MPPDAPQLKTITRCAHIITEPELVEYILGLEKQISVMVDSFCRRDSAIREALGILGSSLTEYADGPEHAPQQRNPDAP